MCIRDSNEIFRKIGVDPNLVDSATETEWNIYLASLHVNRVPELGLPPMIRLYHPAKLKTLLEGADPTSVVITITPNPTDFPVPVPTLRLQQDKKRYLWIIPKDAFRRTAIRSYVQRSDTGTAQIMTCLLYTSRCV